MGLGHETEHTFDEETPEEKYSDIEFRGDRYVHVETYLKLRAENARLNNEVVKLREELALSRDLRRSQAQVNGDLSEQLAAAQAVIEQMRETDLKIVGRNLTEEMALAAARLLDKANGRRFGAETLWQVLFDAAPSLTIASNLDALHEARALECERLAKTHGVGVMKWLCEEAAAHRARKQATKEEGK